MHLSLTTFIIEIVNFLVLVWILKRLFIGPVQKVIAERKASVSQTLEESEKERSEAEALKASYENRLKDWDAEKAALKASFQGELEAEKKRQMDLLQADLDKERLKFRSRQESEAAETEKRIERQAMEQASGFAARLLSSFASPELDMKIVDITVNRIGSARPEEIRAFRDALAEKGRISVRSAHPLGEDRKGALSGAFSKALGSGFDILYTVDPGLVSGLEIELGSIVLRANLRDELQDFSESGNI